MWHSWRKGFSVVSSQGNHVQKLLDREFSFNFAAQFVFSSVTCILIPTIPIYLSRSGAQGGEIGLLVGILNICSLLPRPFIGRALSAVSEEKFMIAGAFVYMVCSLGYIFASPFWPFFGIRIIQGIGLALFSTASYTLIANIAPEAHRGQVVSYYSLSANFAFALAPYIGILLMSEYGFSYLMVVCTALSGCALLISSQLKGGMPTPITWKEKNANPPILSRAAIAPALMAALINLIWGSLGAFFPLYALKHGVSNPGTFFVLLAVTLNLGRLFGARLLDRYQRKTVMVFCMAIVVVSIAMLSLSASPVLSWAVAVMLGLGLSPVYPTFIVYAIERSETARGSSMGTFTALADLGTGVGPILMGLILQWTSYPFMFLCLSLIGIFNLLYFWYVFGRTRSEARHSGEEAFGQE
jgi:MFS family permease